MSKLALASFALFNCMVIGLNGCQPVGTGYPAAQQRVRRGPPYYTERERPTPADNGRYTYRDTRMPAEPRPAPAVSDYLAQLNATQTPGQSSQGQPLQRHPLQGQPSPGQPQDPYARTRRAQSTYDANEYQRPQYDQRYANQPRVAANAQHNATPYASLYVHPDDRYRRTHPTQASPAVTHAPVPGDNVGQPRQTNTYQGGSEFTESSRVQSNVPIDLSQNSPRQAIALQGPPRLKQVSIREGEDTNPNAQARPTAARDNNVQSFTRAPAPKQDEIAQPTPPRRNPIDEMIAETEAELAARPSDARAQWRKSMLYLAAGEKAKAGAISSELTEEQRGLLARQVALDASVHDVLKGDQASMDRAYEAASAMRDALRDGADLLLPTLTLCSKVTTFGVYDELPASAIKPYAANQAIVYCEIKNLAARRDDTGNYRTQLATRMELFTADGRSMWRHSEDQIEDVARQRREDFFVAQLVRFPEDLGPGEYILKATVTDLISSKTNEVSRRIKIDGASQLTSARR